MQVTLENNRVLLQPLQKADWAILWPIAKEIDIFTYGPSDISSPEKLQSYIDAALAEAATHQGIPFLVYDKTSQEAIGCTRFGNIDPRNKVLHIGWTWIDKKVRGTGFNHEMKYLMLRYAFETLQFKKVEFRIDERNVASRKAVEKLGASLEGILRQNLVVKNGFRRNSCCYGILLEEWPIIKSNNFPELSAQERS